jgi:predicted transcriptional regulator
MPIGTLIFHLDQLKEFGLVRQREQEKQHSDYILTDSGRQVAEDISKLLEDLRRSREEAAADQQFPIAQF